MLRIIFWGTPEFALPSLRALLGEGHEVVGVVTQPDRPAGRGRAITPPPVKAYAEEERLPVFQPAKPHGDSFLNELRALEPDLFIVVAYGRLLRPEVLELPTRACINVHPSLLPELRGAAPIHWAIIRGHEQTGITIMRMAEEMDAGPILFQVPEPLLPDERASDLSLRLAEVGAAALIEALALMELDGLEEKEQDHDRATYAPRLTRENTRVDWTADAAAVDSLIRGLDAMPGAWTLLNGRELKVYRSRPDPDWTHAAPPGTVLDVEPSNPDEGMLVACGRGAVWVREVKPAGKRRMITSEWLRGRGAEPGDRLE